MRQLVGDRATPVRDRVRVAASIGALMGVLGAADAFADVPSRDLSAALVDALRDLLGTQEVSR